MTTELANTLNKSLSIGNQSIAKRLVLAPMAFAQKEYHMKTDTCHRISGGGTRSLAIWFVRFLEPILT
jgi:hypothetical protein